MAGSSELQDFAFALLIGVASGAYSSIFIASPVLTHWKEREPVYRSRRRRIEEEYGFVPAYAGASDDVEPVAKRPRSGGRLTAPEPETVSASEFEQMKRDLEIERTAPARHTSTLTKRLRADRRNAGSGTGPREAEARARRRRRPRRQRRRCSKGPGDGASHAPDIAENEGVAPVQKPKRPAKARPRNRRHGRRR